MLTREYRVKKTETQELEELLRTPDRELARQDGENPDAVHLSGAEFEAVNAMWACLGLLDAYAPDLQGLARRTGAQHLRTVPGLLKSALFRMTDRVSRLQLKALYGSLVGAEVTVASKAKVPGFVTVDVEHLNALTQAVLENKCAYYCTVGPYKSKGCPIRQALECVPGEKKERGKNGECPYAWAGGGPDAEFE